MEPLGLSEQFKDLIQRADNDSYQYMAKRLSFQAFLKNATPFTLCDYLKQIEAEKTRFTIFSSFQLARQHASPQLLDVYFNEYPDKKFLDLRAKKVFLEFVEKTSPENLVYILNHPNVFINYDYLTNGFLKLCSTYSFSEQYPSLKHFVSFCDEHNVNFSQENIVEGFLRQLKTFEANITNLKLNEELKHSEVIVFFVIRLNMQMNVELESYLKEAQLDYIIEMITTRDMKNRLDEKLENKPVNKKNKI